MAKQHRHRMGGGRNQAPGGILIRDPQALHARLCKGCSDLIGLRQRLIFPRMLGCTIAQFVALEIKAGRDRLRPEQITFLDFVRGAGGVALGCGRWRIWWLSSLPSWRIFVV